MYNLSCYIPDHSYKNQSYSYPTHTIINKNSLRDDAVFFYGCCPRHIYILKSHEYKMCNVWTIEPLCVFFFTSFTSPCTYNHSHTHVRSFYVQESNHAQHAKMERWLMKKGRIVRSYLAFFHVSLPLSNKM